MRKNSTLFLLALLTLSGAVKAQSNYALDPAFGTGGIYTLPTTGEQFYCEEMARQADGKIVSCGAFVNPTGGTYDSAGVMRLNANGTVDSTYGTAGFAKLPIPVSGAFGGGLRMMPSGKTAVAIFYPVTGGIRPAFIVMDATGHVDAGFNGGAGIPLALQTEVGFIGDIEVQSTGKIITVYSHGATYSPASLQTVVKRWNTDGTLDATFGTGGAYNVPGFSACDIVAVDAGDRIYFSNYVGASFSGPATCSIYRLTANGMPDASWGTAGRSDTVLENTSNNAIGWGIALRADGKVISASLGGGSTPSLNYYLHQFTAAGHLDPIFGTGGKKTISITGFDANYAPAPIVMNGKKVVMMTEQPSTTVQGARDILLVQTDSTGNLDNSFGTAGILRTPMGVGQSGWMEKLTDGAIAVGAYKVGSKGEIMRFKQTPAGIAFINGKMEASIFPNPATTQFTLRCESGVLYALYDMAGREVLRGKTGNSETTIRLESLPTGAYSLICTDGVKNAELRVVKQ